jgi:hypothetical protein
MHLLILCSCKERRESAARESVLAELVINEVIAVHAAGCGLKME